MWQKGNATLPLRLLPRSSERVHLLTEHDHALPSHSATRRGFSCPTDGRTAHRVTAHSFASLRTGSGPLLDRSAQPCAALKTLRSLSLWEVDIHVEVPRVEDDLVGARRTIAYGETGGKLADDRLGEPSAAIRVRVERARELQRHLLGGAAKREEGVDNRGFWGSARR